jgi:hypothetical protein
MPSLQLRQRFEITIKSKGQKLKHVCAAHEEAWRVACETQTLASLSQKERLLNGSSRAKKEGFFGTILRTH